MLKSKIAVFVSGGGTNLQALLDAQGEVIKSGNMLTKIAVFVSGGGTNLQALIDAQESGIIKSGKIELVISNNADAYALTRAENAGIKTAVVSKKELGSELFEESYQALRERRLDAIIDKRPELIGYDALKLILANLISKEKLPISHKVTPRIVLRANSELCFLAKEEENYYGKDNDFE